MEEVLSFEAQTRIHVQLCVQNARHGIEVLAPVVGQTEGKPAVERVTRIELAPPVWKTGALPLSYTRIY